MLIGDIVRKSLRAWPLCTCGGSNRSMTLAPVATNLSTRSFIRCNMTDLHSADPASRTLLPVGVSATIEFALLGASPDDEARTIALDGLGFGKVGFTLTLAVYAATFTLPRCTAGRPCH